MHYIPAEFGVDYFCHFRITAWTDRQTDRHANDHPTHTYRRHKYLDSVVTQDHANKQLAWAWAHSRSSQFNLIHQRSPVVDVFTIQTALVKCCCLHQL